MYKIIGVDFDDVLFACNEALCEWHNQNYGSSHTIKDVVSYELNYVWGCTETEALDRVRRFLASSNHTNTLPVEGAVEGLRALGEENCYIVTARAPLFREQTVEWLEKHIPKMAHRVHYVGTEHGFIHHEEIKPATCVKLGVDVFIDDSLIHARGVSKAGIPVLLLDNPWNQADELPLNVKRVYSWGEIVEELQ
jgi:uncharacterized HAD superfamily protein